MFQSLSNVNALFIENILISVLCGAVIFIVFYLTNRKVSVSNSFSYTLILLPPVACMLTMVINTNIALAIGMLGTLSIIRFRHSMKESKNIAFVFWAVTVGITCGLSYREYLYVWFAIVAVAALLVSFIFKNRYVGTLSIKTEGDIETIEDILYEYSIPYEIKYKNMDNISDILFELRYRKKNAKFISEVICEEMMEVDGVLSVRFIRM